MPRVSVIVPVHDRVATLPAALDSVAAQTWTDYDVLVVDDASHDDPAALVAARAEPRVACLRLPANVGAGGARNAGVAASSGELVAFLDSDDEWLASKLATQIAFLDRNPALAGCCSGFELHRIATGARTARVPAPGETTLAGLLDVCGVGVGSTLLVRRAAWDAVGGFAPELRRYEDWDWLLRCCGRAVIGVCPEVLATVHLGPQPGPAALDAPLALLLERQRARILALAGAGGLRRFRASLAIERAVAASRHGQPRAALLALVAAAACSPGRLAPFLARLARRVGRLDF